MTLWQRIAKKILVLFVMFFMSLTLLACTAAPPTQAKDYNQAPTVYGSLILGAGYSSH